MSKGSHSEPVNNEETESTLRSPDGEMPAPVQLTRDFFLSIGIWHRLARNPPVTSCREAADRRERLGYVGIPLSDELRSYVLKATNDTGGLQFVLLHCRGNQSISFDAVRKLHFLKNWRIEKAKLGELDDNTIGYGLVNPFTAESIFSEEGSVVQVFDSDLMIDQSAIGTMMTNAGERTWAVEFIPRELVTHFRDHGGLVANISEPVDDLENLRSIGILTGNAPESGGLLWRKVNEKHRNRLGKKFRGDTSYPDVQVHSRPWMGLSMELSTRSKMIEQQVVQEVKEMSANGAELLAFACNTTQFYGPRVDIELSGSNSEFVSLPSSIEKWIKSRGDKSIFVAGIGYVTEDSDWSAFRFLHAAPNVILPDDNSTKAINELAYQVKLNGVDGKTYQKFRSLFRNTKADYFLLLLTELSLVFEKYPRSQFGSIRIVDAMDLYADSIVEKSFSEVTIR